MSRLHPVRAGFANKQDEISRNAPRPSHRGVEAMHCLSKNLLKISGIAAATAFAAFAPDAVAQEITTTGTCQAVGANGAPEPLGDREGHGISISQSSCHIDSGPMKDGILTGTDIFEWDGPNAVLVSGSGIARKPGATVVYVETQGKLALMMADGKVTGSAASARGTNVVATGSAASMAGKAYTVTSKPIGPGQFTFEAKTE
jgi:hypothetical protein